MINKNLEDMNDTTNHLDSTDLHRECFIQQQENYTFFLRSCRTPSTIEHSRRQTMEQAIDLKGLKSCQMHSPTMMEIN